jgi:hypothetical protein
MMEYADYVNAFRDALDQHAEQDRERATDQDWPSGAGQTISGDE